MKWRSLTVKMGLVVVFFAAAMCTGATVETDNGAKEIMIDAGPKGSVFFPHRQHQEMESITCQACHELFPQEPGSIARLKNEGTLKARQVMNNLCISCHRKTALAGRPSGPRSCNICHGEQ